MCMRTYWPLRRVSLGGYAAILIHQTIESEYVNVHLCVCMYIVGLHIEWISCSFRVSRAVNNTTRQISAHVVVARVCLHMPRRVFLAVLKPHVLHKKGRSLVCVLMWVAR